MCWWPYAIVFMVGLEAFQPTTKNGVVILAYLNSLINPCLYMIINRDVRLKLKKIFRCIDPKLVTQSSIEDGFSSQDQHLSLRGSFKRIKRMLSIEEKPTEN